MVIDMKIEPLSERTLENSIALLHRIFPEISEVENPDIVLPASLNPEQYRQQLAQRNIPELRYWVALNETEQVAGIVGLYSYGKDQSDASWLGWYGVSPEHRGKCIGRQLLDYAIDQAKGMRKKYLRLYTSTDPNESVSHELYERRGFVKTGEEPLEGTPFKKLFFQLDLTS